MNIENIITLIHMYLKEAEAEEGHNPALILMNRSFTIGKIYGLLEILQTVDLDRFVTEYESITGRLHALIEKNDILYVGLKEA